MCLLNRGNQQKPEARFVGIDGSFDRNDAEKKKIQFGFSSFFFSIFQKMWTFFICWIWMGKKEREFRHEHQKIGQIMEKISV